MTFWEELGARKTGVHSKNYQFFCLFISAFNNESEGKLISNKIMPNKLIFVIQSPFNKTAYKNGIP